MSKITICPICENRPTAAEFKPFCSKRCADVDLQKWLSDGYAIPGRPLDDAEEAPSRPTDSGFDD
ncbi:MAG: DNA gyrase inhibitor YacG [Ponticaulis sp.]|nr:DNA gyrase inhibitor YacG [Ponticaulis sp.]